MKVLQKFLLIIFPVLLVLFILVRGNSLYENKMAFASSDDDFAALDSLMSVMQLINSQYVEPIKEKDAIYGAIKGMLEELDPHSSYFSAEEFKSFQEGTSGSFGGLGITISMKDGNITVINALEDTPAWKAGIKGGDVILKINDEPTTNMALDNAVKLMRGNPGTKLKITIARKTENKPLDFELKRAIIKINSVKSDFIDKNIGYIRLSQFQDKSYYEMAQAMKKFENAKVKGIVLDLRNNGGGLLKEAIDISSIFLPKNKTVVFTRDRNKHEEHYKTQNVKIKNETIPMVVIINEWSASASEIVAGALQDYKRAIIVGKTSFGKGSVQSIIPLRDGSAVKLTTSRYYTPLARSIQGVGIKPDIEIDPGFIEYGKDYLVFKEKDLSGHLVGENEENENADKQPKEISTEELIEKSNQILPPKEDLQYISAVQLLKGMIVYGNTSNK